MEIIQTNLKFTGGTYGNNPKALVLHNADASKCTVEDVHRWHLNNGWAGIGYHYFVRKDGKIYKGRPDNMIGSHALHHNTNTLGICAEGKYNTETMPEAQKESLKWLVGYLKGKYNITKVYGHRELMATDCPGKNYPLDEIRGSKPNNDKPQEPSKPSKPEESKPEGTKLWENSIRGQEVKNLQSELNKQCGAGLKVDGYFGDSTLNACITVREGAKGNITKCIQQRLLNRGYDSLKAKGGAYGVFGNGTTVAVKNLQKNKGLSVDGIVGKNTWKALYSK